MMMETEITKKNKFNSELESVFKLVSLSQTAAVEVKGSFEDRRNFFYGDIDLYQNIKKKLKPKDVKELVQRLVNHPDYFTKEIKLGHDESKRLIADNIYLNRNKELKNFNLQDTLSKIPKNNKKLIRIAKSKDFVKIRKHLRVHILRWTAQELLRMSDEEFNEKQLLDNPGIFKIDFIKFMHSDGNFQEFSIIYNLPKSTIPLNRKLSLTSDYELYMKEKNYFKALKRLVSLGKVDPQNVNQKNLGLSYQIKLSIENLLFLIHGFKNMVKNDRIRKSLSHIEKKINFLENKISPKLFDLVRKGKLYEAWKYVDERILQPKARKLLTEKNAF